MKEHCSRKERFASGDVCLCIAANAGPSETQIRHRLAEVHQLSMHVVLEAIRELNGTAAYLFENGKVLMGKKIKNMQVVQWPLR